MIYLLGFLAISLQHWPPVDTFNDLRERVAYVDRQASYFVEFDGARFRMGTPIHLASALKADVPQTDGALVSCSDAEIYCIRFWVASLAAPRKLLEKGETFSRVIEGIELSFGRNSSGEFVGSGICHSFSSKGCSPSKGEGSPAIRYEYRVNEKLEITQIFIHIRTGKHGLTQYNLRPINDKLLKIPCG